MNPKLTELLAELDKEIIDYGTVTLTPREYDLLRSALREREGMVMVPKRLFERVLAAHEDAANALLDRHGDLHREIVAKLRAAAEGK